MTPATVSGPLVVAPAGVQLVSLAGAAKRCTGVSASTLRTWRTRHGDFPAPVVVVKLVDGVDNYYDLAAIVAWVNERRKV